MAAPTYTSDLADISLATAAETWVEPTNATSGGLPIDETDFFIEGTQCKSKSYNTTGQGGACRDYGSNIAITSGKAVYTWVYWWAPNVLAARASGGLQVMVGSGQGVYKQWYVLGNDNYTYGGWQCIPVDPEITPSNSYGSPSTPMNYRWFGMIVSNSANVAKGQPFGVDATRWGREFRIVGGSSGDGYATFTGAAAWNDNINRRWGQVQAVDGGFLLQGLLVIGYGGACEFVDSNKTVIIPNHLFVASGFNGIEVRNTSTVLTLTNCVFRALGTVGPGNWTATDDANVDLTNCSFLSWGTFSFLANTNVPGTLFLDCKQITAGGAGFLGAKIDSPNVSADSYGLYWNTSDSVNGKTDRMVFTKNASVAHHAIGFGTSASTTIALNNITFSGFSASDGQNDSVLYFPDKGSDTTWTVNCSGVTGTVSYKKARSGDTVNVVNSVTVTLTGLVNPTEVRVYTQDVNGDNDTEIDGIDECTDGEWSFAYTASETVNIVIFAEEYLPADIYDYVMPSSAATIPIQQIFDRQYNNP